MQRYESYKPSGITWVGDIPAHWQIKKNKFLLSERKAVVGKDAHKFKLLSLTLQGVILRDMENPKGKFPAEFNTYKQVSPDDLIFCLFDVEETPRTVGLAKHHGMITGAYTVTCCNEQVSSAFLYYYYLSLDEGKQLRSLYTGLRNVITRDTFLSLATPLPPRKEQDRIVAFLDQKTAEIDAAIAKKERLIELLQEQKKTIRNQVITKGLNLSALQCDSGVPWIGAIPSHWKVCAIKRLFKSMDYGLSESALGDGDFKYLNMGHIKDGKVSTENTGYLASAPDAILLRKNDILFNRTNSFDLVGKSGIYLSDEEDVTFASYMVRIRVKDEICPSWANSLMNSESYLSFIRTLALRSLNQANLNPTRLGAVSVPVPPKEEQEAIADYLDEMSTQVDISIRSIEKELCGLFEMKQTTIANVVTGKIKV